MFKKRKRAGSMMLINTGEQRGADAESDQAQLLPLRRLNDESSCNISTLMRTSCNAHDHISQIDEIESESSVKGSNYQKKLGRKDSLNQ